MLIITYTYYYYILMKGMWVEVLPPVRRKKAEGCLKPTPPPTKKANNGNKCTKNAQNERKKPKIIVK